MSWEANVVDRMPEPRGRGLNEDTKKLIDYVNSNKGQIVKFKFESKEECQRLYHRVIAAKRKGLIRYEKITRRVNELFIKA